MALVQIFAAAALAAAPSAQPQTVSIQVSHADLDLGSAAGRTTLDHRVDRAVRTLCGDTTARELHSAQAARKCTASALTGARAQIDLVVAHKTSLVRVAAR